MSSWKTYFLTAIWLPQGQFWATVEGATSLTFTYLFQPEGRQEPCNEVGSQSPVKHLVGFEPVSFQF